MSTDPTLPRTTAPASGAAVPARIAAAALVIASAVVSAARLRRVEVAGHSMAPTLCPGDRLAVLRVRPLAGRLVVVRDPRLPARIMVKRCQQVLVDGGVVVRGDHAGHSTDSRHFGPVPAALVIGRPVYRYQPAATAGWIWRA